MIDFTSEEKTYLRNRDCWEVMVKVKQGPNENPIAYHPIGELGIGPIKVNIRYFVSRDAGQRHLLEHLTTHFRKINQE